MKKNIKINELSFKDLYITFLKNKLIICFFFIIIMFSSHYYSTNYINSSKTLHANFYSDIIDITHHLPLDAKILLPEIGYTHQEIIKNLYLKLHRDTDFRVLCQEFKFNLHNLISSIDCMRTTSLDIKKFKNIVLINLDKVFEKYIDEVSTTYNPVVIKSLADQIKLIPISKGIVFYEETSSHKIIFINLFSFLLLILLTFIFLIIKSKKR